jgi:hypothetical protein
LSNLRAEFFLHPARELLTATEQKLIQSIEKREIVVVQAFI